MFYMLVVPCQLGEAKIHCTCKVTVQCIRSPSVGMYVTFVLYICTLRAFKGTASGSCTDLGEPDGLEFRASTDSGLHSCDTDSPMFSKYM